MKRILFVCTGNTCRSPMAEAVFRHHAKDRYEVKSAGVFAAEGSGASQQVNTVLKEEGVTHEHASQPLSPDLVDWADLILTMTESHKQMVGHSFPHALDKLFTLKEFAQSPPASGRDIADPFGGSVDVYRRAYKEIDDAVRNLIKKLDEAQ